MWFFVSLVVFLTLVVFRTLCSLPNSFDHQTFKVIMFLLKTLTSFKGDHIVKQTYTYLWLENGGKRDCSRLGGLYMTLTGVGGVDDRAGVTEAARAVLECCSRSAAAASLPGRISPRSTRAALMVSRRRHKNIALKRMFASRGRRDCISVNNADGQWSPRGGSSSNLEHCWRGEAVNCERRASVEALQFHSNTQSHWSSGPSICFPCRGSTIRVPGCTNSQWNQGGGGKGFSC